MIEIFGLTAKSLMLSWGRYPNSINMIVCTIMFKRRTLKTWILTSGSLQLKTLLCLLPFFSTLFAHVSLFPTLPLSPITFFPCLFINERTPRSFIPPVSKWFNLKRLVARFEDKSSDTVSPLLNDFFAYCYKNVSIFFLGTNGIHQDPVKSLSLLQHLARLMNW